MDTAGNQYTAYQYGDIWWMGCTFVLHPSLYFRNIGGFDWGCPCKGYFAPWGMKNLPDGPERQVLSRRRAPAWPLSQG